MAVAVIPEVAKASAFALPWNGADRSGFLRLDLSEALVAPPPTVTRAICALSASRDFTSYPNETAFYALLSAYTGVPEQQHLLTNGSDHGIQILLRAFVKPGDLVLTSEPTFPMYAHVARTLGAETRSVPLGPDMVFDVDAYLAGVSKRVRLLVVVNPNNPTGTAVRLQDINSILSAHPKLPVIVDEAYFEYAGDTATPLLTEYPNLFVLRSFSKAFGLAGLRLGYLLNASSTLAELRKLRLPFDVNAFALVAAAEHLKDLSYMKAYVKEVMTDAKPMLEGFLRDRDLFFFPSKGNFLLVRLPDRDRCVERLKAEGVLVAPQRHHLIRDSIRIGIGPSESMKGFLGILARL
jgi:histidinol-phosphate aminotransferase